MNEKDRLDSLFIFVGIICFILYVCVVVRTPFSGVSINFSDVAPCYIISFSVCLVGGAVMDILDAATDLGGYSNNYDYDDLDRRNNLN